eukprot:scaffold5910_cov103-Isochrysis_galbana.AAC.6
MWTRACVVPLDLRSSALLDRHASCPAARTCSGAAGPTMAIRQQCQPAGEAVPPIGVGLHVHRLTASAQKRRSALTRQSLRSAAASSPR